jgi:hypothetical protein
MKTNKRSPGRACGYLRLLAWQSRDPDPTRRLLALAEIYDGVPRSDAARAGGAGVQIVRDCFNAEAAGH